jgi:hypothetical protein
MSQGTSNLTAHIGKFKGKKNGRLLKLPCVTNVELAVMSEQGVLHSSLPSILNHRPEIKSQSISSCRSLLSEKDLGPQEDCKREISGEGTPSASSFMQDLVRFLALQLKNEGHDKDEDTHSPRGEDLPRR